MRARSFVFFGCRPACVCEPSSETLRRGPYRGALQYCLGEDGFVVRTRGGGGGGRWEPQSPGVTASASTSGSAGRGNRTPSLPGVRSDTHARRHGPTTALGALGLGQRPPRNGRRRDMRLSRYLPAFELLTGQSKSQGTNSRKNWTRRRCSGGTHTSSR